MSSTLPFYTITFHFIHSIAQFTTTPLQTPHSLPPTLPPSSYPTINSSTTTHKSFLTQLMTHEAPIFLMVITLLTIVICGCICFLWYKHLIITRKNNGDSIESESENDIDIDNNIEYESTIPKTSITSNTYKHRSKNNNSDFDIITKGEFITHSINNQPILPELTIQNSLIQNTNAIYGINTDAIIQSPTVIVIKHNNKNLQIVAENENDSNKNIFDSPPSNVFIESPDSVIINDDIKDKNRQFIFVNESQLSESNDSIIVCNGSVKTSVIYENEGQKKRIKNNNIKDDEILKHLKKNVNDQLDENEFEVMGSPSSSPVHTQQ